MNMKMMVKIILAFVFIKYCGLYYNRIRICINVALGGNPVDDKTFEIVNEKLFIKPPFKDLRVKADAFEVEEATRGEAEDCGKSTDGGK